MSDPTETNWEDIKPGSSFSCFKINGLIGRDSSGLLFRARHKGKDRLVAVRILDPAHFEDDEDGEFLGRMERAVKFRHKYIQRVHSLGRHEGVHYLQLEYHPGSSIRQRIEKGEDWQPYKALKYLRKVVRALRVGKKIKLVHSDLRPSNILLSNTGAVTLTGIGMPRDPFKDAEYYEGAQFGRIPFYAAPENLQEVDYLDEKRMVFTIGAILYHMLSGQPVTFGESLKEGLNRYYEHGSPTLEPSAVLEEPTCELVNKMIAAAPLRHESLEALYDEMKSEMNRLKGKPDRPDSDSSILDVSDVSVSGVTEE